MTLPAYESYVYKDSARAWSITMDKPTGVAEGDLIIALLAGKADGVVGWDDPGGSGWTSRYTHDGSANSIAMEIKTVTAGAAEPSSYAFPTSDERCRHVCFLIRVSGQSQENFDGYAVSEDQTASTTQTAPSYTTTQDDCLIIRWCLATRTDWSWTDEPTTLIQHSTLAYGSANSASCTYEDAASAGATGTADWTSDSSRAYNTVTMAIPGVVSSANPTPIIHQLLAG